VWSASDAYGFASHSATAPSMEPYRPSFSLQEIYKEEAIKNTFTKPPFPANLLGLKYFLPSSILMKVPAHLAACSSKYSLANSYLSIFLV
jgi:hypothetical protein